MAQLCSAVVGDICSVRSILWRSLSVAQGPLRMLRTEHFCGQIRFLKVGNGQIFSGHVLFLSTKVMEFSET